MRKVKKEKVDIEYHCLRILVYLIMMTILILEDTNLFQEHSVINKKPIVADFSVFDWQGHKKSQVVAASNHSDTLAGDHDLCRQFDPCRESSQFYIANIRFIGSIAMDTPIPQLASNWSVKGANIEVTYVLLNIGISDE